MATKGSIPPQFLQHAKASADKTPAKAKGNIPPQFAKKGKLSKADASKARRDAMLARFSKSKTSNRPNPFAKGK